jgi:hypothetical protein
MLSLGSRLLVHVLPLSIPQRNHQLLWYCQLNPDVELLRFSITDTDR